MRHAIILALALAWLTPQMVADRCNGEASFALTECSCTVKNRLLAGWNERRVLDHYFAPSVPSTPAQVAQVATVLDGSAVCGPEYFMFSTADVAYLGIGHYSPALTVCSEGRCVHFFERWFRKN